MDGADTSAQSVYQQICASHAVARAACAKLAYYYHKLLDFAAGRGGAPQIQHLIVQYNTKFIDVDCFLAEVCRTLSTTVADQALRRKLDAEHTAYHGAVDRLTAIRQRMAAANSLIALAGAT